MKTIQQVIREQDPKEIENAYFYDHSVDLWEMNGLDDKTLGEIKGRISGRFQAFIKRLCSMDIEQNDDEQRILFVYRSLGNEAFFGDEEVGLVRVDDLLEKEDLSDVPTYAYEFTEQKEALGFLVADTKLTQDNLIDVIVDFLFEVSFFGYEQEGLNEELDKLEKSMKEIDEHPERLVRFSSEELRKEMGLPEEEKYPEEEEKKHKFYDAAMDYTNYCKCIELGRIKNSLLLDKQQE